MLSTALFALFATGFSPSVQAQELRISGSSTVSGSLMVPHEREIETLAGEQVGVTATGSSHGIKALVAGTADMAMISAPLGAVVASINERDPGAVNGRGLIAHEVGRNQVAFVVHPSNPVRRLNSNQLYDILAGRIANWREVGGVTMPIQIMVEPPGGGVRSAVEDTIEEWGDVLAAESYVQSAPLVITAVSHLPGGLGITSMSHVNGSVDLLETEEPMGQSLYLVTVGQPDRRMTAVIEAARATWRRLEGGNGDS
ncbi:MAG: hypothetical protein HKM95_03360 [Inquilinus sp.]|nr:hypothetical protein [Inquilinus sp.]